MQQSILGFSLLVITGLVSYRGFKDFEFRERYLFWTDGILVNKEYGRLLTSGFLHSGWVHFGFNMVTLLAFSPMLEDRFGWGNFLVIYLVSMLGGNLLSLFVHRNHGDYRSLGASGAVSGIILAYVVLYPTADLGLFGSSIALKAWMLGILFVGISIIGMKADADNIGHDAHLGGGITGVLMALFYDPSVALENGWMVALILVPSLFFLYRIYSDYTFMLIPGFGNKTQSKPKHEPGEATVRQMKQRGFPKAPSLDFLLDKINAEGIDSLSKKERRALEEYQKNL